ncbi:hypothetical protein PAHAL_5G197900 [Panicum hallii]|uniref:Bifunctional inhibitor/plant lipid transfer protein/seed storage helical domain-containing protein n=1 Tax=Panicum hallii TaxID=206008 RepID=A0A2S3HST0_9POAL|nr:non-specific lipid-transfer protein 2-like [Panicum hallii]PAN29062.1 hypothetical protein PAHAL_5G197900 [Panicum hallii]
MKVYALQLLLLVAVLAAPCTTVCRASGAGPPPPPQCDPLALRPCAAAVIDGARPSGECCAKVREQEPCLCRYSRNPGLTRYINSREGRRIAAVCRVRRLRC